MTNKKDIQAFKDIKEKCYSSLTDIVVGPMNIHDLNRELVNLVLHRSPEYVVILIEKNKKIKKYQTSIYITREDFKKYK